LIDLLPGPVFRCNPLLVLGFDPKHP
jgi:hypothetical protein